MKVKRMIEELQKYSPEAEVRLHHRDGNNVLFVLAYEGDSSTVVLEGSGDANLKSELSARFDAASDEWEDELDFFMDLLETGFTLDDIKENIPEMYEYSRRFCEEHGLA